MLVHEGGSIDFTVATDSKGKWSTDNPDRVSINSYTGKAVAESSGDAIINYHEKLKHSVRVKVFKAVRISPVT